MLVFKLWVENWLENFDLVNFQTYNFELHQCLELGSLPEPLDISATRFISVMGYREKYISLSEQSQDNITLLGLVHYIDCNNNCAAE